VQQLKYPAWIKEKVLHHDSSLQSRNTRKRRLALTKVTYYLHWCEKLNWPDRRKAANIEAALTTEIRHKMVTANYGRKVDNLVQTLCATG